MTNAKTIRVELKKIQTFEGHDGLGFNADIWINGTKCMHVKDLAFGGCYEYHNYTYKAKNAKKIESLIEELNKFISELPQEEVNFGNGKKLIDVDLDYFINDLLVEKLKEKDEKKKVKLMEKAILIGVKDADSYSYFNFKKPLVTVPKIQLQQTVNNIKKEHCKGGKIILNTNLEKLGIII